MFLLPDHPKLLNLQTGEEEDARILDLSPAMGKKMDDLWWKGVPQALKQTQPDGTWANWAKVAAHAAGDDAYLCVACISADKSVQGVLLYHIYGRSFISSTNVAVEGVLLASAPWNREDLTLSPRYRGTGTALILMMVAHSYALGLGGRCVLKAKNIERTVAFYTGLNFRSLSQIEGGMIAMELEPAPALAWLKNQGIIQ